MSLLEPVASEPMTLQQVRGALHTAVICDALDSMGLRNQALSVALPPRTGVHRLVGRCKTTLWADTDWALPNPYELELQAVDSCQADDVLIAAAAGSLRSGIWGELLSTAARNRGCVGAIVDGGVRDITAMTDMGFPVFARGVCPLDSKDRQSVVEVDVPVTIAGLTFRPGDLVVADLDGIVVIPPEVEEEALRRAWNKVHTESTARQAIRNGMKIADAYRQYGVL